MEKHCCKTHRRFLLLNKSSCSWFICIWKHEKSENFVFCHLSNSNPVCFGESNQAFHFCLSSDIPLVRLLACILGYLFLLEMLWWWIRTTWVINVYISANICLWKCSSYVLNHTTTCLRFYLDRHVGWVDKCFLLIKGLGLNLRVLFTNQCSEKVISGTYLFGSVVLTSLDQSLLWQSLKLSIFVLRLSMHFSLRTWMGLRQIYNFFGMFMTGWVVQQEIIAPIEVKRNTFKNLTREALGQGCKTGFLAGHSSAEIQHRKSCWLAD